MQPTRYLVQASDNSLHGYDREDILRCDLATNKDDPPKQVFRLSNTALTVRYDPIDPSEIIDAPYTTVTLPAQAQSAAPAPLHLPA
jgi:hypothetical protein